MSRTLNDDELAAIRESLAAESKATQESTKNRTYDDAGKVKVVFFNWVNFDKGSNGGQRNVDKRPDAKVWSKDKKDKDGKVKTTKTYKLNFRGMLDTAQPGPIIKEVVDEKTGKVTGYEVRAKILFGKAKAREDGKMTENVSASALLSEELVKKAWDDKSEMNEYFRKSIRKVTNPEGTQKEYIWLPVSTKDMISCAISMFSADDIKKLDEPNEYKVPKIRNGVIVTLENVKPTVSVSAWRTYVTKDKDEVGKPGLKINKLSFDCLGMKTNSDMSVYFPEFLRSKVEENPRFLPSIDDVNAGTARIPWGNIAIRVEDGTLDNKHLVRYINRTEDTGDYYYKPTSGDVKLLRKITLSDAYIGDDGSVKKFVLVLVIWGDQCRQFGVDSHFAFFYSMFKKHQTVPFVAMIGYNEKETQKKSDNTADVRNSHGTEKKNDGIYVFTVRSLWPDWEAYLPTNGIKLTAKDVIKIFADANAGDEDDEDAVFKIRGKGKKERIMFKSILNTEEGVKVRNPLHTDGPRSRVLCLGSGQRPMVNLRDAKPILENPDAQLYALSTTDAKNKKEFLEQLAQQEPFPYQIFLVQNKSAAKN